MIRRRDFLGLSALAAFGLVMAGCDSDSGSKADTSKARNGAMDSFGVGDTFKATAPLPYHYFYAGHGGRGAPVTHLLYVRVERGSDDRTIEFDCPEDRVSALQWFRQIPSLAFAAHLRAPA